MTCAVCGAAALRPYLAVNRSEQESLRPSSESYGTAAADIVRCVVCGHAQVQEMPALEDLDEGYAQAADDSYAREEAGQRVTAARAVERIERHVARGALLDLGCWLGFLPSEASKRGWETLGIEPSQYASEFAREQLGLDVRTETIEGADLPGHAYDAVVMADVIEHLPRPGESLERVRELLKPGGVLYLQLPDAGSAVARRMGARWWSVLPTHVQYFTRESLARLLERHGFTSEWIGTAPKTFSTRYYIERLAGYAPPAARVGVKVAEAAGLAGRLVTPNFRDRMEVVARLRP
ncbi:MAG: class I SAM-dependent methyltransferase [Thermoleophilaceae bacterium]|nr:class I SAM-dependent methyltransferase [Thermoleophilaceae bacterium]